jgi:hypothetical protein
MPIKHAPPPAHGVMLFGELSHGWPMPPSERVPVLSMPKIFAQPEPDVAARMPTTVAAIAHVARALTTILAA